MVNKKLQGKELREALEEYKQGTRGNIVLSQKTLKDRRIFFHKLEKFMDENGWTFTLESMTTFVDYLRKTDKKKTSAKSSLRNYIAKLRSFGTYCVKRGYIEENFCVWLQKPPEHESLPEPIHLDIDFELALKAIYRGTTSGKGDRKRSKFIKEESRAAQLFMYHMGHRSGGFVKLRGSDIHFEAENPYVVITLKGGSRKAFPIPEDTELRNELYQRRKKERVFEVLPETTIKHFRNGLSALGIQPAIVNKVNNHTFRKLFAQERDRNGEPVQKIARAMGDTAGTVETYYLSHSVDSLIDTVNNSRTIKHGKALIDRLESIRMMIRRDFSRDDRVETPRTSLEDGVFTIRIPISRIGLEELKRA